jgi:hypothetical protein
MTNQEVIEKFLYHKKATSHNKNLTSTGFQLLNYNTIIAEWRGDNLFLNQKQYSQTTSTIQNKLKQAAKSSLHPTSIHYYEPES